jgi:hypothetical protein
MSDVPAYRPVIPAYRPPIAELERAITTLRKRYGMGLGRRPTKAELDAMKRAAALTIISDHALTDPAANANDVVRLVNAADRARAAMEALLEAGNRSAQHGTSYADELRAMVET